MIKEETDSSDFLDTLHTQQELMLCVDTDKVQPYIEDCIAHKEPLVKVALTLSTHFKDLTGCFQLLFMSRLRNSVQSSYKSIASQIASQIYYNKNKYSRTSINRHPQDWDRNR